MNHKRIEDHPKSKLFKKIDKELEGYWAPDICMGCEAMPCIRRNSPHEMEIHVNLQDYVKI